MIALCDTNIISELARPQPNPGVLSWSAGVTTIALSVISLEEITYGLAAKPNLRIQDWFDSFLQTSCQVIPITAEVAKRAGDLRGRLKTVGQIRTQADMLIAATAQIHQLPLVTRNVRDFEGCGVSLLNPFQN
jgi:predicted nucleic acid-binding protein